MNEPIIITTPAELRSIVADEVAAILPKLADFRRKNEPVEIDNLSVEEAVRFIAEQGIPTTRSTIYNWVFLKKIPFKKIGRRTVFSKKEGLCWSDINTMFLKCRKKEKSIHDVKSMSIFGVSNLLSEDYIITMINSTLISHYVDNFVNNTQTFQINDARQLPIIIPTSTDDEQAKSFVSNAIKIKKGHTTNNALDVIQKEVDSYVEKIYNL